MTQDRMDYFEANPIIAAVKSEQQLDRTLETECRVVFFLFGDICSIARLVQRVKESGRLAFVHLDLIRGLSGKEVAVEFIKTYTRADGIISTRPELTKHARELGLAGILRIFVIDSMALGTIDKQLRAGEPDILEIMPGIMPKIIREVSAKVSVPVIAGGLIRDKEDVMNALSAGALCISTTSETAWTDL